MSDTRYQKTLDILRKIDRLIDQLGEVDPYGDICENFSEVDDKGSPVTRRLIKMVEKDIAKASPRNVPPSGEVRLRLFKSHKVVSSQLCMSIDEAGAIGSEWARGSGARTYAITPAKNPKA